MTDILLITPPLLQPNSPYPATAYLKGYLGRNGISASQLDLSVGLLNDIFSQGFLREVFDSYTPEGSSCDDNIRRIYALREKYISTIDAVMRFLRSEDTSIASLICTPDFIPQGGRFAGAGDMETMFGTLGSQDCARYIATYYLQDISDLIRAVVSEDFDITRYAEKISLSVPSFKILEEKLSGEPNMIENRMLALLDHAIRREDPKYIGFTIPFPGNLLPALRCAQYIKSTFPRIKIIFGGGYPSTELRSMSDKGIFNYTDYIILDDGEKALENIIKGDPATGLFTRTGFIPFDCKDSITHLERGCPDYSGLDHTRYFSLLDSSSPMMRLWSDGRWNKMMLSHGCYWGKCAFCDTTLPYICDYDTVPAARLADWMEHVYRQTGSSGFHFVDEAASPKVLRELSLELISRGSKFSWWTNIRFEKAFTGDLCRLMAEAGCIAVSGGLEVASDRLLEFINKGITIESATITMRNFFYAGIMVHTYLMYGLPTQTLQETVDSLEIVRQMFRASLIDSAYWHRYAMTVHSPGGREPERMGVKRKNDHVNTFANNEIFFIEDRRYNVQQAGEALRTALYNYMNGEGLEMAPHKWFSGKAPQTEIEETVITDHIIKPDSSRLYDEKASVIWLGPLPEATEEGILLRGSSREKHVNLDSNIAAFVIEAAQLCGDLTIKTSLGDLAAKYSKVSEEAFTIFYHSKKWDIIRSFGFLQI